MDGNCHVFDGSFWEMLLNAIEQQQGNAEKIEGSCWEMFKSDSLWAILKGCRKSVRNAQIKRIPAGQMSLLAGCDETSGI
jgi:hypothetical protein